jgi:F420-dependent oxidoreductase-like protein
MPIEIGLQVWASHVGWSDLMTAGRRIDELGFATLWSNDHFVPVVGPETPDGPIDGPMFEGWTVLGGLVAATRRIRLGCLVSGAPYRNPGLLVKMATALDHASDGRVLLGLGAGWHAREHRMFGYPFPDVPERLDRLEEAAAICRALLDGQQATIDGRWFTVDRAVNDPPPVQERLPLVIGGSGVRRTLRIVARYADWWNGDGDDPVAFARLDAILDEHCVAVGRDPATIRRTVAQPPVLVRPSMKDARSTLASILAGHGMPAHRAEETASASPYAGPVSMIADRLRALAEAGATLAIFDWMAPFDPATVEALADLNAALAAG